MQSFAKAAAAALTLLHLSGARAEESNRDLAGRIELRSFQSLTLTDQQFLTGDKSGLPVTITGELRLPQRTTGRVPVVIMLHGAGGLVASNELWSRMLNAMGVATFAIDSHSGRNLGNIGANQGALGFQKLCGARHQRCRNVALVTGAETFYRCIDIGEDRRDVGAGGLVRHVK